MAKYIFLFIALYLCFYAVILYKWYRKYENFNYLIRKFHKFMDETPMKDLKNEDEFMYELEKEISGLILQNFLHDMPLINSLLDCNWESFSLRDHPIKTINTFEIFYDQIIKEYNNFLFNKKRVLNPIRPLEEIFLLPSKILSWFGLTLESVKARLFSGITYLIFWLIRNYGKDIFNWIISLF